MTSPHPGPEGAEDDPYGPEPYGSGAAGLYARPGAYEAAVDALADPLTDPLPGQPAPEAVAAPVPEPEPSAGAAFEPHTSPWFRPHQDGRAPVSAAPPPQARQVMPPQQAQAYQEQQAQVSQPPHKAAPGGGEETGWTPAASAPVPEPAALTVSGWAQPGSPAEAEPPRVEWGLGVTVAPEPEPPSPGGRSDVPRGVSETAALPVTDLDPGPDPAASPAAAAPDPAPASARATGDEDDRTVGLRRPDGAALGRAARRKAAAGKGGARGKGRGKGKPAPPPVRAGTRLEARRAARAAKDGPVVILSRFIGEVFITFGVLMLLFVAYQLWWTNVLAHKAAGKAVDDLEDRWKQNPERKPGKFSAGEGFAIMYIPKLDIRVPVAEGVDKQSVLDKGMVGHYDEKSGLNTAMPWDEKGNFSVAGHRNTHGEPFRYINKLVAGDVIIVETADTYYTYKMHSRLASTSPSNTTVVQPVPPQSGFTKSGRYVTLTTCTPEFTSKYRLIVWGKMVDERPRSKGKPDALVD